MNEPFITKDSGDRRQFDTGAVRDAGRGKGRFDLLPLGMIRRDAQLLERGAVKYGDRNWQKGMPLQAFIDSAFRHLTQLAEGDRTEDHAAAVRWNVAGLEWTLAEIRAGRLPWTLADGTAYAIEHAPVVQPFDPLLQRPDENAKQHRDRVNSPWSTSVAGSGRYARQPDDFASDPL